MNNSSNFAPSMVVGTHVSKPIEIISGKKLIAN
jgi:hypothetical protein